MQLSNSVDQCANWNYKPRFLKRNQISWKLKSEDLQKIAGRNSDEDEKQKIHKNLIIVRDGVTTSPVFTRLTSTYIYCWTNVSLYYDCCWQCLRI